jgi:hypothetical protein
MNRRELFRNLLLISAGASLFPACTQEEKTSSLKLKNLQINSDQEACIEALAETIIPTTDSPGAKSLGIPSFILMMMDDCRSRKDQDAFMKGLELFMAEANKRTGTSFAKATKEQQKAILEDIEKKKNAPEEMAAFYGMTKRLTIQGFTSSEYFLTKVQVYEMIPGRFHGCFPLKNNSVHG